MNEKIAATVSSLIETLAETISTSVNQMQAAGNSVAAAQQEQALQVLRDVQANILEMTHKVTGK